jgi:hypothetical protein
VVSFKDLKLTQFLVFDAYQDVAEAKSEIISLLSEGRDRKALSLLEKYSSQFDFGEDFIEIFERYVNRGKLGFRVSQVIHSSREVLEVNFAKKRVSWYVDKISEYQNIVVISNSSSLSFSAKEKSLLKGLPKPLFVYLNIGNPSVASIRHKIYGSESAELLIGGHHHVVDSESKLIFSPYEKSCFLGCLVRVNNRFQRLWHDSLAARAAKANPGINISELDESLLIDSLYPLSTYCDTKRVLRKRIPSIGWIVIALLDAVLSSRCEKGSRLWLAGFSLTPAYIFHAAGNLQQHDFSFEKEALDYRFSRKNIFRLGSNTPDSSELNAHQHLCKYGFRGQQLSKYLRNNGKI